MTSLFPLQKPMYLQSFMLIYGFLLELWVSNLNEKEDKKKMKNSAHHQYIYDGEDLGHPYTLSCFVIGMAKVLPVIDVLGYDGWCFIYRDGLMCMSVKLFHKFYPFCGCHGNIMLPWQQSKIFITGRKWPQTVNHIWLGTGTLPSRTLTFHGN